MLAVMGGKWRGRCVTACGLQPRQDAWFQLAALRSTKLSDELDGHVNAVFDKILDMFWPAGCGHNFATAGLSLKMPSGRVEQVRFELGILSDRGCRLYRRCNTQAPPLHHLYALDVARCICVSPDARTATQHRTLHCYTRRVLADS